MNAYGDVTYKNLDVACLGMHNNFCAYAYFISKRCQGKQTLKPLKFFWCGLQ